MDFAWVVDALRRGLKVTRKAWAGDPPMYLYMVTEKKPDGKRIIKMYTGTSKDFDWIPTAEQMLTVTDWEEYVEPKKKPAAEYISLSEKETRLPNNSSYDDTQDSNGVKPVEDSDVEEDTGYIGKLAVMLADSYAEKISQRVVQLLQKTDVPLSKEDTNHACTVYHRRRS